MPPSEPQLSEYAAAVGELVLHLRDEGTVLTSLDQHLVATWWEAGYPLETVLRSVREAGERLKRRKQPPRGLPLSAMRKVVEREAGRALSLQAAARVGEASRGTLEEPAGEGAIILEFACQELAAATADPRADQPPGRLALLDAAATHLGELAERDPSGAFVALLAAARCYYDGLFAALAPPQRQALRDEVLAELGPARGRMAPGAVDGAVQELVRRRLRQLDPILDPERIEEGGASR